MGFLGAGMPYYWKYLKARLVEDSSNLWTVEGLPDGPFAGLTITIAGPGGADNQAYPDVVAPADPDAAAPVLAYAACEGARGESECLPGQAPAGGGCPLNGAAALATGTAWTTGPSTSPSALRPSPLAARHRATRRAARGDAPRAGLADRPHAGGRAGTDLCPACSEARSGAECRRS